MVRAVTDPGAFRDFHQIPESPWNAANIHDVPPILKINIFALFSDFHKFRLMEFQSFRHVVKIYCHAIKSDLSYVLPPKLRGC